MAVCFCVKLPQADGLYKFVCTDRKEEAYVLKVSVNGDNRPTVNVNMHWRRHANIFVRLKIYTDTSSAAICQKNKFICNSTHMYSTLTLNNISENNMLQLNVIPYKMLNNVPNTMPIASSKIPIKEARNDEKIKLITANETANLSRDMKSLLDCGNLTDVVLTDGENEIKAHKIILSTRSSVFASAFRHNMKENRDNSITIKDISFEALKKLLDFIYSGRVFIYNRRMAIELYEAADKYDIKDLQIVCSQALKDVNLESVFEVLALADLHNDADLKQSAVCFIAGNYSQVKTLEAWADFITCHKDLAFEILQTIADSAS